MTNNGYYNSFRAMRLNVKEEEMKERRLRDLQVQEDKKLGIWAKKQLRIELQIATKQSPLQRARKIRNKRQEEINRIYSSTTNEGTESKSCEKRLNKRLSNYITERELERSAVKDNVMSEDDITRTISSSSLPTVSVKKHSSLTNSRSVSLPTLLCNPQSPQKGKRPSLPAIDSHKRTQHRTAQQSLQHQTKFPALKNCWT